MAKEYCNKCGEETWWEPLKRGSRRERCQGCREIFPCRHACEHLDCQWKKEEWKKEENP